MAAIGGGAAGGGAGDAVAGSLGAGMIGAGGLSVCAINPVETSAVVARSDANTMLFMAFTSTLLCTIQARRGCSVQMRGLEGSASQP